MNKKHELDMKLNESVDIIKNKTCIIVTDKDDKHIWQTTNKIKR